MNINSSTSEKPQLQTLAEIIHSLHLFKPTAEYDPISPCRNWIARLIQGAYRHPQFWNLHDVVTITFGTGIRAEELAELRWSQVHIFNRSITVSTSPNAVREVPCVEEVFQVFVRRSSGPGQDSSTFVLGKNPMVTIAQAEQHLRDVTVRLSGKPLFLEDIRRSFFGHLAAAGASASTIMAISGCNQDLASQYLARSQNIKTVS